MSSAVIDCGRIYLNIFFIKMTSNSWEMLPAVTTPVVVENEVKVLVTINYQWSYEFPIPENFEEFFGNKGLYREKRKEYINKMYEEWGNE